MGAGGGVSRLVVALVAGLLGWFARSSSSSERSPSLNSSSYSVGSRGYAAVWVTLSEMRCAGLSCTFFQSALSLLELVPSLIPVMRLWLISVTMCGCGSHGPLVVDCCRFLR